MKYDSKVNKSYHLNIHYWHDISRSTVLVSLTNTDLDTAAHIEIN